MTPEISIIIPTWRRQDSLRTLLQALTAQNGVSTEIIVVDQNAPGFLDPLLQGFPAVKRLVLPIPNVSDARNKGFLLSTAPVILFVDDDLIPEANFCRRGLEVFRQHGVIQCFSPLVYNAQGRELPLKYATMAKIAPLPADPSIFIIRETISACLFFRRDYFIRSGGFDPLLFEYARAAEDQEICLRMRLRGMDLYFVSSLPIFHDENVPGGCDLRSMEYWLFREKCMRSWAFRRLIHHRPPGKLSPADWIGLVRSAFLNREGLASGPKMIVKQVRLLRRSVRVSRQYLREKLSYYTVRKEIDHLAAIGGKQP